MEKMMGLCQPKTLNGKVIITGPGRSGTTFLVSLLTELGYDTGFSREQCRLLDPVGRAGLEMGIYKYVHKDSPLSDPYIIKSPLISDSLRDACEMGDVSVEHVYIPVRCLRDVALSREKVSKAGGVSGGFWGADCIEEQENKISRSFYSLIDTCLKFDLPYTLISFPRLIEDSEYLYGKLQMLVAGLSFDEFSSAFDRVVRPELVTNFGA